MVAGLMVTLKIDCLFALSLLNYNLFQLTKISETGKFLLETLEIYFSVLNILKTFSQNQKTWKY